MVCPVSPTRPRFPTGLSVWRHVYFISFTPSHLRGRHWPWFMQTRTYAFYTVAETKTRIRDHALTYHNDTTRRSCSCREVPISLCEKIKSMHTNTGADVQGDMVGFLCVALKHCVMVKGGFR